MGIVLKAGKDADGNWKDDCNYMLKGTSTPMTEVKGYILVRHNANSGNTCIWGPSNVEVQHSDMNCESDRGFYGYKNTYAIKTFAATTGKNFSDFQAAYHAVNYETSYPAPENTSGWFLPSGGQLQYIYQSETVLASLRKALGDPDFNWPYDSGLWYSSQMDFSIDEISLNPSSGAYSLIVADPEFTYVNYDFKNRAYYIRRMLAY